MVDLSTKTMLLGIGAQKAGTTWLHRQLQRHPAIYMSPHKELHHFDTLYAPLLGDRFMRQRLEAIKTLAASLDEYEKRGLDELSEAILLCRLTYEKSAYLEYFQSKALPAHRIFGEFSPAYSIVNREGFEAIRDCHDDVRVVFIMRDPVSRLLSVARMRADRTGCAPASFDPLALLQSEIDVARGRYDVILEHLDRVFTKKNIFIEFYENIGKLKFSESLSRFICVDDLVLDPEERVHVSSAAISIDPDTRAQIRMGFSAVYDYCLHRFGASLPELWKQEMGL